MYYIADFNSHASDGGYQQLSADATKENIWVSLISAKLIDEMPEPKLFEKRADAIEWKDRLQAQADADWRENDYIHKMYGQMKPKFKIYKYENK